MKALIFDFDGVLVSSEVPRFNAIKTIAEKHNIIIADSAIKVAAGKTTLNFLKEILADDEQKHIETLMTEFRQEYLTNIIDYVQPIEFTVNFIHNYDGPFPIAIASMSSKKTIESLLEHFKILKKVAKIVTRDEVTHHKPNPEIYLTTANDLQLQPQDCLVFEDTTVGVDAAIAADMKCCVVVNGLNDSNQFKEKDVFAFVDSEQTIKTAIANFSHPS